MNQGSNKKGKIEQHVVPSTYLKHWRISSGQNFVYGIDITNNYHLNVQTLGLNSKIFKEKKYYNHSHLENPFMIEDFLGENIEPTYELITKEVTNEQNLSELVREKLLLWLYISNMRKPYVRNNIERISNFMLKTVEKIKSGNLNIDKEIKIENYSKYIAKKVHIDSFVNEEQNKKYLMSFIETLNCKKWKVLKSHPQFEFWTNDSPGFSPNTVERFFKETPYHAMMEINLNSIIYFSITPKYCLELSPFKSGTSLDICGLNMEIVYEQASLQLIEYINKGILYTCSKVVVSNNKEILEKCVRRKPKE
jgi:hypothetical protein